MDSELSVPGKNEVVKDGETEEAQEHKENLITEEKGGNEQQVLKEAICGTEKPEEESRETTETHLDNEKVRWTEQDHLS